jgi:hypothetical protein
MTTVNAVGQQYGYLQPGGVTRADSTIYPDGQQYAWLVGTATVSIVNALNVVINPSSQSYVYQLGTPTLQLTTFVTAVGQQINWQLGSVVVQTSTNASVFPVGQQYNYGVGNPLIQIMNGNPPNPIVIVPAPGETFTIEGCPKVDTMMTIESGCGQSTAPQSYIYNGVLLYNGVHTYGAS